MLGACAFAPTRAIAQDSSVANGWDIRAGLFIPERDASRSRSGSVWLAFGAERAIWALEQNTATLGVGYYGGDKMYAVPVLVTVNHDKERYRLSAGIGFAMQKGISEYSTAFAYKVGAGVNVLRNEALRPLYADLSYRGTTGASGQLNGFELSLAYTF
jgi:hypothetical protein